jgi:DNA-binding CsgD family transcriptional regulator
MKSTRVKVPYNEKPLDMVISKKVLVILQMVANDIPRTEIAERLDLSIRTIHTYLDNVRNGVGCNSIAGLIAFLIREKVIK